MAATDKTRIPKASPIVEDEQGQLRARGISREVVEEMSRVKGEPDWMREKRLKSYEIFARKPVPTWGVDLSDLNFDDLVLYSPPTAGRYNSWDDVPADVTYNEGCTAQTYSVNSMHSAVVELFVKPGAKARYTTVQNWSKDVYNLNTKRAVVEEEGTVEWVGGSMGAKYVMLYPGSFLMGAKARADHLNVGVASGGVWKDTGAKVMHLAPETTSNILAKSISKDGGIMGYRGLVRMGHNSQGSKARVQCDGLTLDEYSRSDTWPV